MKRLDRLAAGRSPYADHEVAIENIIGRKRSARFAQGKNGDLQGNGVYIVPTEAVAGIAVLARGIAQIKNTAEVHVKRIVRRAAEYLFACGGGFDGARDQVFISGSEARCRFDGTWADVWRGHDSIGYDGCKCLSAIDTSFQSIRGFQILLTQADVEKRRRVFIYFVKCKPVHNFITRNARIVVDMDFVQDVFSKRGIIRAAKG